MTTRKMRISAGVTVSGAILAAALIPATAYASAIDPEDPGPASGPCPEGWGGTPGDCDPPNDIDVGGDGSDEGDGDENAPGGEAPGADDEEVSTDIGIDEGVDTNIGLDESVDTGVGTESCDTSVDDMILPEEPVADTPRREAPRQQDDGLSEQEIRQVMLIIENDRDQRIGQINSSPMQEESTSAMGPSNLEGLGVGG